MKKLPKLPMSAQEMRFASLEQLEQIINHDRHNGDVASWVYEARDEILSRGFEIIQAGSNKHGDPAYQIKR